MSKDKTVAALTNICNLYLTDPIVVLQTEENRFVLCGEAIRAAIVPEIFPSTAACC